MPGLPNRPTVQHQGPAGHCVVHGRDLSWLSCTCYAMAMVIDAVTFGTKMPSGCRIRTETGDIIGGTTVPQVSAVAREEFGLRFDQFVGANVIRTNRLIGELREGRPFVAQGNTSATLHTRWRSTNGPVNHAVAVIEGKNWHKADGLWLPRQVLVYDPAADKRRDDIDDSPSWWNYDVLVNFGAQIRPWGDDDPRTLGGGRMYAALAPPPEVRFRYGGGETKPLPDRLRVDVPKGRSANIRSRPDSLAKKFIVDKEPDKALFIAYQVTDDGKAPVGSKNGRWYGNWRGDRWIHASNVINEGGDR